MSEVQVQEQEINFDQAQADEDFSDGPEPVAAEDNEAPVAEPDVLEILVPKADPKAWVIGQGDYERTYVQRPLSFIAKMQWFSLVGDVLDKALSGPNKMSMNSLLTAPAGARAGQLSMSDFADADTFIQAIGKLLAHAPEFLLDSYAIWLGVPSPEKDLAKQIMSLPAEDGGLSDEQGVEIIEVFIDQNYDALDAFFRERVGELRKRVDQHRNAVKASRRSKR